MNYSAYFKFIVVILLGSVISCLSQPVAAQSSSDIAAIEHFIANQAKRKNGSEYEEARKIMMSDLNHDGKEDAVVLYTLEGFNGKNNYRQYLAIFIRSRDGRLRYVTQQVVGGKLLRIVELESVKDGKINFQTSEYLPTDAACCPSGKGHALIVFKRGRLKEV